MKEIRGGGGIKQNGRQRRQIRREKRAVNGAESVQAREKGKRKDLGAAGMAAKGKSGQRAGTAEGRPEKEAVILTAGGMIKNRNNSKTLQK